MFHGYVDTCILLAGVYFQSESMIAEELSSLKTCLNIRRVNSHHLQVPFPALNKLVPSNQQQVLPTQSKKTEAVEETQLPISSQDVCSSSQTITTTVDRTEEVKSDEEDLKSSCDPLETVDVAATNRYSMSSSPSLSPDWRALSRLLITELERAVHSRVVRAPYLPSSSQTRSDGACLMDLSKSDSDPVKEVELATATDPMKTAVSAIILGKARIAILFSGGVDSVVLAALVDRLVREIMHVCCMRNGSMK